MKLVFPSLYAIMDAVLLRTTGLARLGGQDRNREQAFAEMLARSGVELIQYRDKQASSRSLFESSRDLARLLSPLGVKLIVNDRADIAVLAGADGVHVGQEDLGVEQARAICGSGRWVGVSTNNLTQVQRANTSSADYIAVGPIFATQTKEKPDPIVGLDFICKARLLTSKPLVAIGGITLERAAEVYSAGADSLAVAGDLIAARDPAERARQYIELGARARSQAQGVA
jgi:thiamine-phosphate pyrophosphorylase